MEVSIQTERVTKSIDRLNDSQVMKQSNLAPIYAEVNEED